MRRWADGGKNFIIDQMKTSGFIDVNNDAMSYHSQFVLNMMNYLGLPDHSQEDDVINSCLITISCSIHLPFNNSEIDWNSLYCSQPITDVISSDPNWTNHFESNYSPCVWSMNLLRSFSFSQAITSWHFQTFSLWPSIGLSDFASDWSHETVTLGIWSPGLTSPNIWGLSRT